MSCWFSNLRTGRKENAAPLLGARLPYGDEEESSGQ